MVTPGIRRTVSIYNSRVSKKVRGPTDEYEREKRDVKVVEGVRTRVSIGTNGTMTLYTLFVLSYKCSTHSDERT